MFPCLCSDCGNNNRSGTRALAGGRRCHSWCSYHILISSVICYWTDTWQIVKQKQCHALARNIEDDPFLIWWCLKISEENLWKISCCQSVIELEQLSSLTYFGHTAAVIGSTLHMFDSVQVKVLIGQTFQLKIVFIIPHCRKFNT